MPLSSPDLPRTTLGVLFIALLIVGSLWILQPFIGPGIWAAMLVVSTWPLLLRLQRRLWGRRWLAVTVMTLLLVLLLVLPLTLAVGALVAHIDQIGEALRALTAWRPPPTPPAWLAGLPFVGPHLVRAWEQALSLGAGGLLAMLTPYAGNVTRWLLLEVGSVGRLLLQFLVTTVLAAVMYATGERWAAALRRFARRLGGAQGESVVDLAGQAIRGVALGVGLTALLQALFAGIGLGLAGVPLAGLLTLLMFMLCIAQLGALPVLLPATVWVFWNGATGWGVFLLVWSLVATTMDNVVRPVLIRMGADLPLLLIFTGVVGGLLAFGLVGIFIGPVVLAVAYTLLDAWARQAPDAAAPPPPAA
ncbi:AI-2E family transporter YdiK [Azohydromonas sp. G-1-1-14]|uniref:AI-2E family transporter YdiK n=2 Tax=Azohydromonas caseinilytica TaxID=2728836 RepID=A0A848F351_9BURK|nr:AI-2E family transporter YdiK [Azohydromonas caseinilytica]